jgi:anaerobic selenocysteine-containing dehydrogenase
VQEELVNEHITRQRQVVGGGARKVLYTLETLRQIGVGKAAKALTSKNACKACGYGMGGQKGGMVNELGEFPSVCNKSVQAQSTDIQPAIPNGIFEHTIADLAELSGRELEHLGRLNAPLLKEKGGDRYRPIGWSEAIARAAARFRAIPPYRAFFYSSGRSSNEAGFVLQLLARAWGTNNVNNCS